MDPRTQERQLHRRCLAHDRAAWRQLVERYSRLIYGVIYATLRRHGVSGDEEVGEELFHQTFLALYDRNYRKLRQWNGRCSLASWIRLVATSTTIDHLRRQRPLSRLDDDEGLPLPGVLIDDSRRAQGAIEALERAQEVRVALMDLASSDRELLEALFHDEREPREVALALGITPGALYTRKNRALGRLREAIVARRTLGGEDGG